MVLFLVRKWCRLLQRSPMLVHIRELAEGTRCLTRGRRLCLRHRPSEVREASEMGAAALAWGLRLFRLRRRSRMQVHVLDPG